MTILEAVRALTVGDCPTRREAIKTIRKYFENGDPVERIREEISDFEEEVFHRTKDFSDYAAVTHCLEIVDKYREPQGNMAEEDENELFPVSIRCGYGLYDCKVHEKDGKYICTWMRGSSCD